MMVDSSSSSSSGSSDSSSSNSKCACGCGSCCWSEGSPACGPFLDLRLSCSSLPFKLRRLQLMLPPLQEQLRQQQQQLQEQRQQQEQPQHNQLQQQQLQQQLESLCTTIYAVCERLAAAAEQASNPAAYSEAVQLLHASRSSTAAQQQQQLQRSTTGENEARRREAAADEGRLRATRPRVSGPGASSSSSSNESSSSNSICAEEDAAAVTPAGESSNELEGRAAVSAVSGSSGASGFCMQQQQQQQQRHYQASHFTPAFAVVTAAALLLSVPPQQQHKAGRRAGSAAPHTTEKNLKAALAAMSQGDYEGASRLFGEVQFLPFLYRQQPQVLRMRCLSLLLADTAAATATAAAAPAVERINSAAPADAIEAELLDNLRCLCNVATAAPAAAAADLKSQKPTEQKNKDAVLFRGVFALRQLLFAEAARCCFEALEETAAAAEMQHQQQQFQQQQQQRLVGFSNSGFTLHSSISSSSSSTMFSASDLAFYGIVALLASPPEALKAEVLLLAQLAHTTKRSIHEKEGLDVTGRAPGPPRLFSLSWASPPDLCLRLPLLRVPLHTVKFEASLRLLLVKAPRALRPLLLAVEACDFAQQSAGIKRAALSFAADVVLWPVAAAVAAAMQRALLLRATVAFDSLRLSSLQQYTCLDIPALLRLIAECRDTGELPFDWDEQTQVQKQQHISSSNTTSTAAAAATPATAAAATPATPAAGT
ncbi:hypothetical protein Esti_004996 [Eimeria stiedai]